MTKADEVLAALTLELTPFGCACGGRLWHDPRTGNAYVGRLICDRCDRGMRIGDWDVVQLKRQQAAFDWPS